MSDPPVIYLPEGVRLEDIQTGERGGEMAALERSVVLDRSDRSGTTPLAFNFWSLGGMVGGITEWGVAPKQRDRQLWNFSRDESYFASALGIVAGRNAAMNWSIQGDELTAEASQEMLNNANFGGGWEEFITRLTYDLETCDSGAFVELVRSGDTPESPVIGLNTLDSLRCHPTGDPLTPVLYEDVEGRFHAMKWYQVVQLLEMAAPRTFAPLGYGFKLQVSAATRVLRAVQILKNIAELKDEKTGGRFMRAVHLVSGVDGAAIEQQLQRAQASADNEGLLRYIQPAIVATVKPDARVDHAQIDLATLPDNFDEEKTLNAYILALSMGLMADYQEFAPLPGGGLGTGSQSEILHAKARGKGPGLFRQLVRRLMNLHGVLPRNVEFVWDDDDIDAEEQRARTQNIRAEARSKRIQSGELLPAEARQIAVDEGDLPIELFEAAGGFDMTPTATIEGGDPTPESGLRSVRAGIWPGWASPEQGDRAARPVPFGQLLSSRLHRMYADVSDDAHGLGYFRSTAERIKVANAIGPALAVLEDELKTAGIWGIEVNTEDADRLVDMGVRELTGSREARAGPDDERLAFEDEVAADVLKGLGEVRRALSARLRA